MRPIGVHFGHRLLRNTMTTAVEFLNLFFTTDLINHIVNHTNSYAFQHIAVPQPWVISNYNKFMNAVDRSDQILGTNSVHRKCVRWWKTLFFHLIDLALVNSYILFQEHRANSPDEPALQRPATYSLVNYREEVACGLWICRVCGSGGPTRSKAAYTWGCIFWPSTSPTQVKTGEIVWCAGRKKKQNTK